MTSSHAHTALQVDDKGDRILLTGSAEDLKRMADIVADARSLPAYAGSLDVHAIREGGLTFAAGPLALPVPEDMTMEWIDAGGVPACWFRRADMSGTPLLYLHGGGFCGGSVAASRGIAAALPTRSQRRCLRLSIARDRRILSLPPLKTHARLMTG